MGLQMHALAMAGFGCVREREGCAALGPAAQPPKKRRSAASWAVERAEVLGWRPDDSRRVKCTSRAGGGCSREMEEEGLRLGAADAKRMPKGKGGGWQPWDGRRLGLAEERAAARLRG